MTLPDGQLHPIERQLLAELGALDPATSQAETPAAWQWLVAEAGGLARVRPAEGEWSALEVLGHLTVVELANGLRYRAMLVAESPALADFEQSAWSPLLRRTDVDAAPLLAMFGALRRANLDLWAHLDAAARARTGVHPECGPETLELRFSMLAGHNRIHLEQARRAVEAARNANQRPRHE